MQRRRSRPKIHFIAAVTLLAAAGGLIGCDSSAVLSALSDSASPSETLAVLAASAGTGDVVAGTDAGTNFDNAQAIELAGFGKVVVSGTLKNSFDVNVYSFGPLHAGDVFVADVSASPANARAALYDEEAMLVEANDDRNYYGGQRDPRIQVTARRDFERMYLAVNASGSSSGLLGLGGSGPMPYQITLTRGGGVAVPPPQAQVVWLEFGGGAGIRIAAEAAEDVPPFDPGRIVPELADQRGAILDRVVELMQADYAAFNVTLLRGDRDPRPSGAVSTLYFGGYSNSYLGLADNVDYYNAEPQQEAIVYTDTLSLFATLRPSAERVAQAIANVAAHELGHLLGLEHTHDPQCLMSIAGSAQQVFNIDAGFTIAPLYSAVFPIGRQDCAQKLAMGAGLRDASLTLAEFLNQRKAAPAKRAKQTTPRDAITDDLPLESLGLRMCNHREP